MSKRYGLLKLHKSSNFKDILIRPVVTFIGSPIYKLFELMNQFPNIFIIISLTLL